MLMSSESLALVNCCQIHQRVSVLRFSFFHQMGWNVGMKRFQVYSYRTMRGCCQITGNKNVAVTLFIELRAYKGY